MLHFWIIFKGGWEVEGFGLRRRAGPLPLAGQPPPGGLPGPAAGQPRGGHMASSRRGLRPLHPCARAYGWGGVVGRIPWSIFGNYVSGSCSVAWATWGSNEKWTYSHRIPTNERVPNACVGGLVYGLKGLWYEEVTMHMCGMCMLALMTLARVGKQSS